MELSRKEFHDVIDYIGSEDFWKNVDSETIMYKELVADILVLASTHVNNLVRREYSNMFVKERTKNNEM